LSTWSDDREDAETLEIAANENSHKTEYSELQSILKEKKN